MSCDAAALPGQVLPHATEQLDEPTAVGVAESGHRLGLEPAALLPKVALDRLALGGELQPHVALVRLVGFARQQLAIAQALHQAGELSLVSAAVRGKVAQRGAGVAGEEAHHLRFHVGHVVGAVSEHLELLGAELVHDGVDEFEHALFVVIGWLFDNVNLFAHDVDIVNQFGSHCMSNNPSTLASASASAFATTDATAATATATADGATADRPASRVRRVRHELKRRELTVERVDVLGPHLRSIVFTGESLADFTSASFDDHVKFFVPLPDGSTVGRDYTPRAFDRAERRLTIEFAIHGDGPAANWARQAAAGQAATIGGPKGSFVVPTDYDWHLLVGDDTALPAITRRLSELPSTTRAVVLLNVPDVADRRELSSAAQFDLQWFDSNEALATTLRALQLPAGDGYAWLAGEATAMPPLRRMLVEEKHHPRSNIRAASYWKRGSQGHHENLDDA
ncbi:MAG: FAD-binding protein [Rhizobacter sp.]|nr:FAD-binding protein [Rhizobacter sp.]